MSELSLHTLILTIAYETFVSLLNFYINFSLKDKILHNYPFYNKSYLMQTLIKPEHLPYLIFYYLIHRTFQVMKEKPHELR